MDNHLFTEQEARDIFSEDISVKRLKELKIKADNRFSYIMHTLETVVGRKWDWRDFNNEDGSDRGNPVRGYFDSERYRCQVYFVGNVRTLRNENFHHYDDSFPTSWLWTNFEEQLIKDVSEFENRENFERSKKMNEKQLREDGIREINANMPHIKQHVYQVASPEMRNNFVFLSADKIYTAKLEKEAHIHNAELAAIESELNAQKAILRTQLTEDEFMTIEFKKPQAVLRERQDKAQKKNMKMK